MSRLRLNPVWAKAALAGLALAFVASVSACDEDGKTAPATCLDPPLPIYDIQNAGTPSVDNPCVTDVGHSVSSIGSPTPSGGTSSGGKSGSGTAGETSGASGMADAGAGGA